MIPVLVSALALGAIPASAKSKPSTLGKSPEAGIAKAQEIAKSQNKLIFIKFGADWCPPCVKMEQTVFVDPEVMALLSHHTIPISIEVKSVRKPKGIFKKYDVRVLPTLVFIDENGAMVDRHDGYLSTANFLKRAQLAVSRETALDRAIANLEQAGPNNPKQRQELADAYRDFMRYPDALAEYEWCVDEGAKHDPNYLRQRTSAFFGMCDLAQRYPPAKEAVDARLEAAKTFLLHGSDDLVKTLQHASDFVEINRHRDKTKNTIRLYRSLNKDPAKKLQAYALLAVGLAKPLHEARRSSKLASVDLVSAAELLMTEHQRLQESLIDDSGNDDGFVKLAIDLLLIQRAVPLFEVLLEMDQTAEADKVADSLLAAVEESLAHGPLAKAAFDSGNTSTRHVQWAWDSVKADPDSWQNLITLARILADKGQDRMALKILQERLQDTGDPDDIEERRELRKVMEALAST